jgi:hypothetical protein
LPDRRDRGQHEQTAERSASKHRGHIFFNPR